MEHLLSLLCPQLALLRQLLQSEHIAAGNLCTRSCGATGRSRRSSRLSALVSGLSKLHPGRGRVRTQPLRRCWRWRGLRPRKRGGVAPARTPQHRCTRGQRRGWVPMHLHDMRTGALYRRRPLLPHVRCTLPSMHGEPTRCCISILHIGHARPGLPCSCMHATRLGVVGILRICTCRIRIESRVSMLDGIRHRLRVVWHL